MSRTQDHIFQDFSFTNDNKNSTRTNTQVLNDDDDDDDWSEFMTPKKPTTNTTVKRQDTIGDDADQDDGGNRTGGNAYVPSFGAVGGLASTFPGQPRPGASAGIGDFDNLFGNATSKTTASIDTDKAKKSVRFDDFDSIRPSTAPAPATTASNRSNLGVLSSLRTALDPQETFDMFSPTKTSFETNKSNDYLGLKDESQDEDNFPPFLLPKTEPSVITTIVKKNPVAPVVQEKPPPAPEPQKKPLFSLLEDELRQLEEKSPLVTNNQNQNFLLDDRTSSNKRPATAGPTNTLFFTDNQPTKSTIKSSFDAKDDFEDALFKTQSKDPTIHNEPLISTGSRGHSSSVNLDMKRLEFENEQLKMTVDHMKRQHEIEINMLKEGYEHRLDYVEKSCERRETRLKEENEHLIRQVNERTHQYESERTALLIEHQRRLDDLQRDRTSELENLRTVQKQTIENLRREYDQTIQRLKQLKQEEVSTALDVTTHTRAFESVIDHMEQNAKNIDALRLKVEAKHSSAITDKEIEARAKEQQLKVYEERVQMQLIDFERERKNLQELISRLEVHLSEQTKLVEEERWKALQAQKRMEAMQDALSGEQRLFMEKIARDRAEIQRGKDQLLEDQKIALASVYETRTQLSDERAKIEALQKTFQEQKQRDMLQNASIEAEIRAQQRVISEQTLRLEKREQELIKREEALLLERRSLTELKQRLEIDQSTIKSQQEEIKQKLLNLEHATESIKKEKERLSQLYFELHALDGKSTGRLQELHKSINYLRQQEDHMNEQYSRMANERENLNHLRSSVSLRRPMSVNDSGFATSQLVTSSPLLPMSSTQQSVEESALVRALRMNALQDQLYIQEETSFLNSLHVGNPLATRSTSHSNLHHPSDSRLLRTNH